MIFEITFHSVAPQQNNILLDITLNPAISSVAELPVRVQVGMKSY